MLEYHTTADGTQIKLENLELGHLKNIIAMIERKAKEGVIHVSVTPEAP